MCITWGLTISRTISTVPLLPAAVTFSAPDLQVILGVSVDIERKYPFLPAAGIRWKMAPQWVLMLCCQPRVWSSR